MGPLALLVTAILATLVLYFWARKAQLEKQLLEEREENERIMSIAEDLQARLGAIQKRSAGRSFNALDRLCEQYYIYEGTDNLQPKLLKEAKAVIEDLRSDAGQLEKTLDSQKNGLISKFRAQLPKVREEEVRLFCFLAAGFNSTTISTLMEKDKQNIYNKIWRLKTRISESDAQDKELFLTYFSK